MYTCPVTECKHCQKPFLYFVLDAAVWLYKCLSCIWLHYPDTLAASTVGRNQKPWEAVVPRAILAPALPAPSLRMGVRPPPPAVPEELLGQSLCVFTVVLLQPELRLVSSTEHLQNLCTQLAVWASMYLLGLGRYLHMDKSFWLHFLCKEPVSLASTLLCNRTNTWKWEDSLQICLTSPKCLCKPPL